MTYAEAHNLVAPLVAKLRGTNALKGTHTFACPACKMGTLTLVKAGSELDSTTVSGDINGKCSSSWCVQWRDF